MLIAALTACGTSEAKKAEDTGGEKSKVNAETDATAAATKELEEATSFVIKGALDKDLEFTVDEIKGLAARDVETQLKDSGGNVTDITARGPTKQRA
ncbi:MAG TPA: hypothetical protein GXX35_00340 [Thermoanaerobacterales bacterium]|nr:hypothetical protein [Thermoanaerobacterales bacterium]